MEASDSQAPRIEGYEILHPLGRGGMADVYLGTQLSLARPVAIKVLANERLQGADAVTRFEHEARTIAHLDHPHIVSIFDVGRTQDGRLYYVMPYLPNGDLSTRKLQGRELEIASIVRALCSALAFAHQHNVVHRDVKPENVLFDSLDRPLLADFGIAFSAQAQVRVTREGSTIGSAGYMSPEQARGQPIDGRSDLYSLGVVCYELLLGELPYKGGDTLAVALAHVEQPIPRLPPELSHWQAFVDKALAKSPDARFQTAAQMQHALDALVLPLGHETVFSPDTQPMPVVVTRRVRTRVQRLRIASLIGAACACALLFAAVVFHHRAISSATPIEPAAPPSPAMAETPAPQPVVAAAATSQPDQAGAGNTPASDPPEQKSEPGASVDANAAPAKDSADDNRAVTEKKEADAAAPPASHAPVAGTLLRDRGGPALVFVPALFTQNGRDDIGHAFALARYDVTRRDYEAFAHATNREPSRCRVPHQPFSLLEKLNWREPGFDQDEHHPVVCVSWEDANAYAQWLGARLHVRYRLPTRAEWLHAAHVLPAFPALCAFGNFAGDRHPRQHAVRDAGCENGMDRTAPVGSFKADALGVYDLVGNVSVWTLDCMQAEKKREHGGSCSERGISGSSWRDHADARDRFPEDSAGVDVGYTTIGIRLVRELEGGMPASGS